MALLDPDRPHAGAHDRHRGGIELRARRDLDRQRPLRVLVVKVPAMLGPVRRALETHRLQPGGELLEIGLADNAHVGRRAGDGGLDVETEARRQALRAGRDHFDPERPPGCEGPAGAVAARAVAGLFDIDPEDSLEPRGRDVIESLRCADEFEHARQQPLGRRCPARGVGSALSGRRWRGIGCHRIRRHDRASMRARGQGQRGAHDKNEEAAERIR